MYQRTFQGGGGESVSMVIFIPDFRKLCDGFNIFIAHLISGVYLAVIFILDIKQF